MAAPKLKDLLDAALVEELARAVTAVHPRFNAAGFVKRGVTGLAALELTPRAWHIAEALWEHLPRPFARAAEVLTAALGPELPESGESSGVTTLRYMPHGYLVQKYGLDDLEAALRFQYVLTKRFTAEWSIRPYLERHREATLARLREWSRDGNVHVRRLVSEGTRPRLPWAPRLPDFQRDPSPVLALLELLKDDEARYVQRSVANNLNDIAKDHPETVLAVCRRWRENATPGREWIVGHALRSLVKQGNREALALLGGGARPKVSIEKIQLEPRRVRLGGKLRFSFELVSTAKRGAAQEFIVDYAVYFMKANGIAKPKVFKLRKLKLAAGASIALGDTVSFADLTTRRHYAGRHSLELIVNGVAYPLAAFDVTMGSST